MKRKYDKPHCTRCGKEEPAVRFYRGAFWRCVDCTKAVFYEWIKKNPKKYKAKAKRLSAARKLRAAAAKKKAKS